MQKIAFYGIKYFPSRGGTSRVAENLILQLKDRFDITIYCYKSEGAEHHMEGVKVVQFKPLAPGAIGAFIYFLVSALHLLLKGKADLIHAHKTDCAFFIPLLKLRFKVLATSHEAPYTRDKWNKFVKFYFHMVERIFIKSPTACTCISSPLTDYYQKKYGRVIHFIPNGISLVETGDADLDHARTFLPPGATLDKPFILFASRRLMSTKGCHTMLEALIALKYTGQVFIAGELTESKHLRHIRALSLKLNVHFLGFVNPLTTLLALTKRAELFIFPSETEGMSIMLLEVASIGRPIIASDIPENTSVFSEKEVLYFKVKDAGDLAEKVKLALSSKDQLDAMGSEARRKVFTDYNWSNIAISYADIYDRLTLAKAG
jgi:glycosyltransferase involved in cell wall biosynthesis